MKQILLIWTCLILVYSLPLCAKKTFITWPEEQTYQGDYFVTGSSIEILGDVKGDVMALGARIIVKGHVEGDVVAIGGTIEISGPVDGSARLVGGEIELIGKVEKNVSAVGGNVTSDPLSIIGGNAFIIAGVTDLAGVIHGNLKLMATTGRLLGSVAKDMKGHLGQLRLGPGSYIGGNLDYSSPQNAQIDPGAEVAGQIIYKSSAAASVISGTWSKKIAMGSHYTALLMRFVFSFVIGWLLLRFFPKRVKATVQFINKRPWKSLGVGLLVLFLAPLASLVLFISILGFPLALALTAITLLGFYTAKIFTILWLSDKWLPKIGFKAGRLLTFFVGLILFTGATQLPTLGGIFSFIFTLFGLGGLVLGRVPKKRSAST